MFKVEGEFYKQRRNTMKKTMAVLFAMAVSAMAIAGMRAINISSGTKTLDEKYIPYGCAELVGVECLMYQGDGSLSMTVDRTMGEVIDHVDYQNVYATNVVTNLVSKVVDLDVSYTIQCEYGSDMGSTNIVESGVSSISNCSWTYTTYLTRYDGSQNHRLFDVSVLPSKGFVGSTLTGFTELQVSAFLRYDTRWTGIYRKSEIFIPNIQTNISISSCSMQGIQVHLSKSFLYDDYPSTNVFDYANVSLDFTINKSAEREVVATNYVPYVDHVVTNRWSEGVSKTWTKNVLSNAQLTNGMFLSYFDKPLHVFKGDVIKCTSPITSNNPGRVRAIIKDDSYGTQSPFLNEN